jgi:ferrous iron transport protein A
LIVQESKGGAGLRLKDLRPGDCAEVIGYAGHDPVYRSKLLAMGVTKGTVVRLLKIAPLGDPVEVELRGFHLSLRLAEADTLEIRKVGNHG